MFKILSLFVIALYFFGCSKSADQYIDYINQYKENKKISLSEFLHYNDGYTPINKHSYFDNVYLGTDVKDFINHIYLKKNYKSVESCNEDYNNLMEELTKQYGEANCNSIGSWSNCIFSDKDNFGIRVEYRDDQITVLYTNKKELLD